MSDSNNTYSYWITIFAVLAIMPALIPLRHHPGSNAIVISCKLGLTAIGVVGLAYTLVRQFRSSV
jgi:hypothetical protein